MEIESRSQVKKKENPWWGMRGASSAPSFVCFRISYSWWFGANSLSHGLFSTAFWKSPKVITTATVCAAMRLRWGGQLLWSSVIHPQSSWHFSLSSDLWSHAQLCQREQLVIIQLRGWAVCVRILLSILAVSEQPGLSKSHSRKSPMLPCVGLRECQAGLRRGVGTFWGFSLSL